MYFKINKDGVLLCEVWDTYCRSGSQEAFNDLRRQFLTVYRDGARRPGVCSLPPS